MASASDEVENGLLSAVGDAYGDQEKLYLVRTRPISCLWRDEPSIGVASPTVHSSGQELHRASHVGWQHSNRHGHGTMLQLASARP